MHTVGGVLAEPEQVGEEIVIRRLVRRPPRPSSGHAPLRDLLDTRLVRVEMTRLRALHGNERSGSVRPVR